MMPMKRQRDFSSDARFAIDPAKLKEHSVRSGAITVTEQAIATGIHTVSTIALARLLTPEDYGIVAMVTAITAFVDLFRELGLSGATIQTRDITYDQVNALFWINVSLGAVITIIIAAAGPALSWFYHKPQLALVAAGISLTSILHSLATQHGALLTRQLRFGTKAIVHITSLIAGLTAAIVLALAGGTYWSLVANSVVAALWHTGGLWIASGFRPALPKRGIKVRHLVRFGVNMAGANIANYFHRNLDNVLIGRAWGAEQLGLYNKAYSLLMLPISNLRYPLNRVAFPAMSRLQNEPRAFRSYFIKYCALLAFLTMPIVTFLFICSKQVILLLLGPRWLGAAELFSLLALVSFIQPPATLVGTVQLSLGEAGRYFRRGLFIAISAVIFFFLGLPWGARGVAIGYCISTYLVLHPSILYAFPKTPLRPIDFYRSIWKPAFASLVMGLSLLLAEKLLQRPPDAVLIAILLPLGGLIYLAIYSLLPKGRQNLADYWSYLAILRRGALETIAKIRLSNPPEPLIKQ